MHFIRRTAGYTFSDHKRNKEIKKELHTQQITEFMKMQKKLERA
jgi:hypothetical protein